MYKTFGETIASLRRAHGMRQQTLADALAEAGVPVSNQAVSKWENDATLPNAQQFLTLCRVLDVDDIAGTFSGGDADVLEQRLGKGGRLLHAYANGYDPAPVHRIADLPPPKSIGNSATAPRDLICEADARAALLSLAESVGARLRLEGYQCRTVELSVRTADLHWRSHRMALRHPSDLTSELLDAALALCEQAHLWPDPLRSIGIRALDLVPACAPHQLDLFEDAEHRARQRQLDIMLDNLRARYGKTCVLRGRACFDPALGLVQREEHAFLRK